MSGMALGNKGLVFAPVVKEMAAVEEFVAAIPSAGMADKAKTRQRSKRQSKQRAALKQILRGVDLTDDWWYMGCRI